MDLIKEWWFLITFAVGIFAGLYNISKTLNETLLRLNFEITKLTDSLTESKSDRIRLHARVDGTDDRLDKHETRISVLEDWRRGK